MASAITISSYLSIHRQVHHWIEAAKRLSALDHLASLQAWYGIDHEISNLLRQSLRKSIDEVIQNGNILLGKLKNDGMNWTGLDIKKQLLFFRDQYLRAESTIHFYTDALNSRTNPEVAALLRACDIICIKVLRQILEPLGKKAPAVMTYINRGVGAAILKAGLRLWDGSTSPIAAIKITHHNLFRPTAIIHEAGHQIAHILNWNDELAAELKNSLVIHPRVVGEAYSSWASEIAADAFAFVYTGYAAVAALHDVVSGSLPSIFAFYMNDPHPISYVRVLLGIEMCRHCYGPGPWDQMETAFKTDYNVATEKYPSIGLVKMCVTALPDVVRICLRTPFRAFSGKTLSDRISPETVSPKTLRILENNAGPSLFTSHAWIWKECIRLVALTGYKIATLEEGLEAEYRRQQEWMIRLGFAIELN